MQDHGWWEVLVHLINGAHITAPHELPELVDGALQPVDLVAEIYLTDLAQQILSPLRASVGEPLSVDATVAGRAYRLNEVAQVRNDQATLLWIPLLDGTSRLGVLRVDVPDHIEVDEELRQNCWALGSLLGHLVMTKFAYGDTLHRTLRSRPLSVAAELVRHLLPPLTFATDKVVVTAVLEPFHRIGGDAFDYAMDDTGLYLAIFDGVGHDLQAGLTTSVALAATRNARRNGTTMDLVAIARQADEIITEQFPERRFVTAVLAHLDVDSGRLRYLLAGHPAPLLMRATKNVKKLDGELRTPLGVHPPGASGSEVAEEHLEPGDRLLLYTDGVELACDPTGQIFGLDRLVDFTERSAAADLPPPETLRRLSQALLEHQRGELRDDATLVLAEWSASGARQLLPRPGKLLRAPGPEPAPQN